MPAPSVPNPPIATPPLEFPAGGTGTAAPPVSSRQSSVQDISTAPTAGDDKPDDDGPNRRRRGLFAIVGRWAADGEISAWLASALVHAAIVLILALLVFSPAGFGPGLLLEGALDDNELESEDLQFEAFSAGGTETTLPSNAEPLVGAIDAVPTVTPTTANPTLVEPLAATGEMAFEPFEAASSVAAAHGGGLDGRRLSDRHGRALAGGGSDASEAAVEAGLKWLAEHQYPDGSWRFNLEECPNCSGYCRNSGRNLSSTAATGLALLSFLGAGYTHREGKYVDVVERGVYYLTEVMSITSHGGDLRDRRVRDANLEQAASPLALGNAIVLLRDKADTMYAHGIASLALTEAYAMTRDQALREPAEQAVKFIVSAQHSDGGWRYQPTFETPDAGDVTVSGWQAMALKSGALGGIPIPYEVWRKLSGFLDGNAVNDGAEYAYYRGQRGTRATSAIGLLCRMFEGWSPKDRAMSKGLANLGAQRPQDNHMYYNYYATLVLHHAGGSEWRRWNPKMRDYLVDAQSKTDHEAGSWYIEELHSGDGGRLYTTALSVLTLEVYYRYLPLYREGSGE